MNLYRYVGGRPINLIDPSGLAWSDYHHWFPQSGKLQTLLAEKCGPHFSLLATAVDFIDTATVKKFIDLFTTNLTPGWGYPGSPHRWMHHEFKWNDRVEEMYISSRDCCELLVRMKTLIQEGWQDAARYFSPPGTAFREFPDIVNHPRIGPPVATTVFLDIMIDRTCRPEGPDPCPRPVERPVEEPVRIPVVYCPVPEPDPRWTWGAVGTGISYGLWESVKFGGRVANSAAGCFMLMVTPPEYRRHDPHDPLDPPLIY